MVGTDFRVHAANRGVDIEQYGAGSEDRLQGESATSLIHLDLWQPRVVA